MIGKTLWLMLVLFSFTTNCVVKKDIVQPTDVVILENEATKDIERLRNEFERVVGNTVYYSTNSSNLSEAAKEQIRKQAEWLLLNQDVAVRIEGYCDHRGSQRFNLELARRRAEGVRQSLISYGINANRIDITAYGKDLPKIFEAKELYKNRRAVTVVVGFVN